MSAPTISTHAQAVARVWSDAEALNLPMPRHYEAHLDLGELHLRLDSLAQVAEWVRYLDDTVFESSCGIHELRGEKHDLRMTAWAPMGATS